MKLLPGERIDPPPALARDRAASGRGGAHRPPPAAREPRRARAAVAGGGAGRGDGRHRGRAGVAAGARDRERGRAPHGARDGLAGSLAALAAVIVARALLAGAFETSGRIGATRVMSELRGRLAEQLLIRSPVEPRRGPHRRARRGGGAGRGCAGGLLRRLPAAAGAGRGRARGDPAVGGAGGRRRRRRAGADDPGADRVHDPRSARALRRGHARAGVRWRC